MKKGFTLVELLAVIVILSILALIITPLVINLINEAEVGAELRAAELYINAVEHDLAAAKLDDIDVKDGIYEIMNDGNLCLGTLYFDNCSGEIFKIKATGSRPIAGYVDIESKLVVDTMLKYEESKIIMEEKGIFEHDYRNSVCFAVSEDEQTFDNIQTGNYLPGAEYLCEVKPGVKYRFYILNTEETHVNLIMDQNININGTPAGVIGVSKYDNNEIYNLVKWGYDYDPQPALQFLYNATKDWTNIDPLNYAYEPVGFVSVDGVAKINGYEFLGSGLLRARLPIYSNNEEESEVFKKTDSNKYLHGNLSSSTKTYGYWTFTPYDYDKVWLVSYTGNIITNNSTGESAYGVRPVINVSIELMENNN